MSEPGEFRPDSSTRARASSPAAPSADVRPDAARSGAAEDRRRPTVSHRLEYAAVRAVAAVFRALPPERASAIMGRGWRIVAPRLHRHARALAHLRLALPELDEAERERIARDMWEHLGRVSAEALFIDRLLDEPGRVELSESFGPVTAAARHGAILATPHLGNWEVAPIGPRIAGLELAAVYQPIRNPLVERHLKAVRAPAYPAGLYPKGASTGRRLIKLAKAGGAIGLVADIRENRGIEITFFGEPATATPMPALLARLGGVPLVAGAMVRTSGVRFRYLAEIVPVPVTDDRDRDVRIGTQRLHDVFERWIRAHPEQWMWAHRKWVATARGPLEPHRPRRAAGAARAATAAPLAAKNARESER